MTRKFLYLPIEEAARELDARLLLAVQALEKGYDVVIGQQWLLVKNLRHFTPGTVFFKGTNRIQFNWMQHARKTGHATVALDEEVTAIAEEKHVVKGIDPELFDHCDRFFMQGENQDRIYKKVFGDRTDIFRITGNPRFDLLRGTFKRAYFPAASSIRQKYGRYILLNSNFGCFNSHWGSFEEFVKVCKRVGFADWDNPEDRRWFKGSHELEKHTMKGFIELTGRLRREFPHHRVLIRPHPAENMETWTKLFARVNGVEIVHEGAAIPWILASEYFIHNTCTTGTEAMLLGVPVGAYSPFTNWKEAVFLSNMITPVFRNEDDVVTAAAAAIEDRGKFVEEIARDKMSVLKEHIRLDDRETATARILKEIDAVTPSSGSESFLRSGRSVQVEREMTERELKKISLSFEELAKRAGEIGLLAGTDVRLKVKPIGESLFHLSRAPASERPAAAEG